MTTTLEQCFGYFPTDEFSKTCQWLEVKCSAFGLQKIQVGLPYFCPKLESLYFFILIPGRVKNLIFMISLKKGAVLVENKINPNLFFMVIICLNFYCCSIILVAISPQLLFSDLPIPACRIQSSPTLLSLSMSLLHMFLMTRHLLSLVIYLYHSPWSQSVCSLCSCLWLYFDCLFVLLISSHLQVRSLSHVSWQ